MKTINRTNQSLAACACQSEKPYASCCKPYHDSAPAPTAEALMRSRYSAYVLKLEDYLLATWHPETRPTALNQAEEPSIKWLGLDIVKAETKGETAIVEFIARYKIGGGKAERLHEISQFKQVDGRWYYVAGSFIDD